MGDVNSIERQQLAELKKTLEAVMADRFKLMTAVFLALECSDHSFTSGGRQELSKALREVVERANQFAPKS